MKYLLFLLCWVPASLVFSQPVIYKNGTTIINGAWTGGGTGGSATLTEVGTNTPYEGGQHYQFTYNFYEWWAGFGLNMDNWGTGAVRDFSGYSHIRLAYRGLSSGQSVTLRLRNGSTFSNEITVGTPASSYTVVDIPMLSLTAGTSLSASAVREINISVTSATTSGSGTLYIDAIELVNVSSGNDTPSPASAATMQRAAGMGKGFNASNWLEAYWLIPFNAYPETNRYTRTKFRDLRNAGFTSVRLPVTFERLGSTGAPYTLDVNHPAFALVDSAILWANIYGMNLILVNHHGYSLTNSNYTTELPRLRAVWRQLTQRYDYLDPNQFFFEIMNEPTNEISNTNWRTVAKALVEEIRTYETQTHSLVVGANEWNSGTTLLSFTPLPDEDVIYTYHNYDPYYFTHQGMSWTSPPYFAARTFPLSGEVAAINQLFANVRSWADGYAVPVFLGEYGCSTAADATSRCNWIQTMSAAINTTNMPAFYWDAVSPSDAFGFYAGGVISQAAAIDCFESAMGLYSGLSVTLEGLDIACNDDEMILRWRMETPEKGVIFQIEESADGTVWRDGAVVNAVDNEVNYAWKGNSMPYIRLKISNADGEVQYSPLRYAHCFDGRQVRIFPNPTGGNNILHIESTVALQHIRLTDLHGRVVAEHILESRDGITQMGLPLPNIPKGMYVLFTSDERGEQQAQPVQITD